MILKANDPNLYIPRPSSCSVSDGCNLLCAATPFRWKNLPDYAGVKDQLYDNYLDPRGNYRSLFRKYGAYLTYTDLGGGLVRYERVCLRLGNSLAQRVRALDGGENYRFGGHTLLYPQRRCGLHLYRQNLPLLLRRKKEKLLNQHYKRFAVVVYTQIVYTKEIPKFFRYPFSVEG